MITFLNFVLNASFFYYLGWWLCHEHYESDPNQIHLLSEHYWKIAIPFSFIWLITQLYQYLPIYLYARPISLCLLFLSLILLISMKLPLHENGINPRISFSVSVIAFCWFFITHPRILIMLRSRRIITKWPTKKNQIIKLAKNGYFPIAQGWNFWLGYRQANNKTFVLADNWSGICRLTENSVKIKSGTSFRQLRHFLRQINMTLIDRSQFDELSLGGAVYTRGHGWNAKSTFMDSILNIEVVDSAGKIRHVKEMMSNYIIIYITLRVVPDKMTKVIQQRIHKSDLHNMWDTSDYRMALINGKGILVTTAKIEPTIVQDNHGIWRSRIDHISFLLCGGRNRVAYKNISNLHTVFSTLTPIEMFFIRILEYKNIEIFTFDKVSIDYLAHKLLEFHKEMGGHTEIRQQKNKIALDVSFAQSKTIFQKYWQKLFNIGIKRVSFHAGKYIPADVFPLLII